MNERIEAIAKEAGVLADFGEDIKEGRYIISGSYQSMEKFAELIVRECAQAFESEVDTWKQMDPYQGSIKRQGAKAIKQHFGVEE